MNRSEDEQEKLRSGQQASRIGQKTRDMILVAFFSALIAICAQITVPAAVPFTLQTLAVFLAGSILGLKKGTASILIYIMLGIAGIPVFSNFSGGAAVLLGPTGGYIIGFIAIAVISGFVKDKFGSKLWITAVGMTIGLLVCYIFGTMWFVIMYNNTKGGMSIMKAIHICVIPFLLFDAIKIAVATILSNRLNKLLRI